MIKLQFLLELLPVYVKRYCLWGIGWKCSFYQLMVYLFYGA